MQNRFFKLTNKFICIDLEKKTVQLINENDHPELKIIHIYVVDPDNIELKSLITIAENAKRRGVKVVLHCFNKQDKYRMWKKLKGVPKGEWFHMNLMKGMHTYAVSPEYTLNVIPSKRIQEFRYIYTNGEKTRVVQITDFIEN